MWLVAENSPATEPSLNTSARSGGSNPLQISISENRTDQPVPDSCLDAGFHARQCLSQGMRILVVEDDAMQRLVLVSLLRSHGHEVVAVSDGNAAWEELGRKPFNIVFTDWMMPGMSG